MTGTLIVFLKLKSDSTVLTVKFESIKMYPQCPVIKLLNLFSTRYLSRCSIDACLYHYLHEMLTDDNVILCALPGSKFNALTVNFDPFFISEIWLK